MLEEEKKPVDDVYLDLKKAFDKVPFISYKRQLKFYGIQDILLDWIEAFFMDRAQCVSIGGECSEDVTVMNGVPQGSVLSKAKSYIICLLMICQKFRNASSRFLLMTLRCTMIVICSLMEIEICCKTA